MKKFKIFTIIVLIIFIFQIICPVYIFATDEGNDPGDYYDDDENDGENQEDNKDYDTYFFELDEIEKIKNNSDELSKIKNISAFKLDEDSNEVFLQKLELVKLCPNFKELYICANLDFDKTFINSLTSTNNISLSFSVKTLNLNGINNTKITSLSIVCGKVYNFSEILNLINLNSLYLNSADGFSIIDFNNFENLDSFSLVGYNISNYDTLFSKLNNIKCLDLTHSNLQDSDIVYLKRLSNLRELYLFGTYVKDISFLKDLPNISYVSLPLNVNSLDVLYELPNLEEVYFDGITETKVDSSLANYLSSHNIEYLSNYDSSILTKLQQIISSFNFSSTTTDEEKVEKITEYVLNTMKFHVEESEWQVRYNDSNKTILDFALQYKFGYNEDYSMLEYALLTLAGIDNYLTYGYNLYSQNDIPSLYYWNVVKLGENWYGIDPYALDVEDADPTTTEFKSSLLWRKYYLKPTKIDNLDDWPVTVNDEDYINKYFALQYRTLNNPQDTFGAISSPTIEGIQITKNPTKQTYIQNHENLDLTGGELTVTYSDESTTKISLTNENVKVSGFDNTKIGTNTITVEYEGKTTTFNVNIVSKQISSIAVSKLPTKTQYIQNYENLDLTGGKIKITYNDASTDTINLTNDAITVTGFDNSKLGSNTLTVKYLEKTATFNVEIIAKQISAISVATLPTKTKYIQNYESLDLTGGKIKITYNDTSTDTINLTNDDITITGFDNTKLGTNTLTVKYSEKTATFNVEIISKQISSIEISKKPSKKTYIQNYDKLDLTGGELTVSYDDESTDKISLSNENVKVSGFDNSKIGKNTITVKYEEKTCTFDITIISKQIVTVDISSLPTKIKYIQNYENLDLTGGELLVSYNDKTTDHISMLNDEVEITGFNNKILGKNTLTAKYNQVEINFDVEIISKSVKEIKLMSLPTKTKYIQNAERLDLTGGVIAVRYDDNSTDTISLTNEDLIITGFDYSTLGTSTITVKYGNSSLTFDVEIIAKSEEKIQGNSSDSANSSNPINNSNSNYYFDNTKSSQVLPNTGVKAILILLTLTISILSFVFYKKSKKYNGIK